MIWATADNTPRRPSFALTHETPPVQRCIGAKGAWCSDFHHQKVTRSGVRTMLPCIGSTQMHATFTCMGLFLQAISWKPAPRGSKECPGDCNGVGNCNHDSGLCECPAGWKGEDCKTVQKRPCTNRQEELYYIFFSLGFECNALMLFVSLPLRHRNPNDESDEPLSHIDADGRDINWLDGGTMHSRCAGTRAVGSGEKLD